MSLSRQEPDERTTTTTTTKTCECTGCECTDRATTLDEQGMPVCGICAMYTVTDDGDVECLRARMTRAVGQRRLCSIQALVGDRAAVTVRARGDDDDCLSEVRHLVEPECSWVESVEWTDATREEVTVTVRA